MKKYIYPFVFSILLASFTLFVILDTFVISRPQEYVQGQTNNSMFSKSQKSSKEDIVYETDSTDQLADDSAGNNSAASENASDNKENDQSDDTVTDTAQEKTNTSGDHSMITDDAQLIGEYRNDGASIKLYKYYYENTTVYAADIIVSSSEYIRTAFANGYYGKNVTAKTSSTARENDAILAINGDYYGARENGYVIRNGIVYRDSSDGEDVLCIYADGTMKIVSPEEYTAQELVDSGVWQAFSFGPALLQNGQISVTTKDEVGKAMASNPRTAVGMIDSCHYVFVVSDGRTNESKGLSLYQLAAFMQKIGVNTAYNLDGGGSSTLYFNGEIINYPTTSGKSMKERGVSDIVYIAK